MGMYVQINLSCIVKPEYRTEYDCFVEGKWEDSKVKEFCEFGKKCEHARWISFSATADLFVDSGTCLNEFNQESGHLKLSCAFKDDYNTLLGFHNLLPLLTDSLEQLEEISEQPYGMLREHYILNDAKIVLLASDTVSRWDLIRIHNRH